MAIAGVLLFQSFWIKKSWDLKEEEFNHTVSKVLRNVASDIAAYNKTELPKHDLIQRRSSNYYSVNVNSAIDANILEDFLYREFNKVSFNSDFEYAVYDCSNGEYLYSNYCNLSEVQDSEIVKEEHPKFDDLIYYFVVKFPSRTGYIIRDLRLVILFGIFTIISLLSFMYALWSLLRQKQVTDMQSDFINNMTHEFKTPISSIKIASDYLLQHPAIKAEERTTKYMSIIKDQNQRLNDQVEKVLSIARLERDQFRVNKVELNLLGTLSHIIEQESIKVLNVNGSIKLQHQLTLEPIIEADKLHFTNIITNVLDNAIKYCKKTPDIIVNVKEKRGSLLVSIQDNGIGIEKESIKKIFDKFYRVSTGNVHDIKGFGLGLFYVKNIVDAHGWEIKIDSVLNKGTKTQLIIPTTKQKI